MNDGNNAGHVPQLAAVEASKTAHADKLGVAAKMATWRAIQVEKKLVGHTLLFEEMRSDETRLNAQLASLKQVVDGFNSEFPHG